jgi:hypothetical protein
MPNANLLTVQCKVFSPLKTTPTIKTPITLWLNSTTFQLLTPYNYTQIPITIWTLPKDRQLPDRQNHRLPKRKRVGGGRTGEEKEEEREEEEEIGREDKEDYTSDREEDYASPPPSPSLGTLSHKKHRTSTTSHSKRKFHLVSHDEDPEEEGTVDANLSLPRSQRQKLNLPRQDLNQRDLAAHHTPSPDVLARRHQEDPNRQFDPPP